MAMSILYLHRDFSQDAYHGKVFLISNLGPIFICWRPRGSLRIPRNHKRGGQGLGPGAGPGQGPGTPARPPLLWFLEILRLPLGLQHMNMGPKLAISTTFPWWAFLLKSLCRYKINMAIYIYLSLIHI